LAAYLLVRWLEPRLTFFPLRSMEATPAAWNLDYQEVFFDSSDGERLHGWYLRPEAPTCQILFFHGNAGNLSTGRIHFLAALVEHNYAVFAFDYRGYGRSSGEPTEEGILLDSKAAARFFHQHLRLPDLPIVYLGRSLGGFASSYAATEGLLDGLVLEGAFPDKGTLLRYHSVVLRFLAVFSRYRLSAIEHLGRVSCPILIIHGNRDIIVPLPAGKALHESLPSEKAQLFIVEGAGHTDHYQVGGSQYWKIWEDFVMSLNT
jgi:pimeloyl-ACP methyl ester carboxylesterase